MVDSSGLRGLQGEGWAQVAWEPHGVCPACAQLPQGPRLQHHREASQRGYMSLVPCQHWLGRGIPAWPSHQARI